MPDDAAPFDPQRGSREWSAAFAPALIVLGAAGLMRASPLFSLGILGGWLYRLAAAEDTRRRAGGQTLKARRAAAARLDEALEESFPASDPPAV